MESGTATPNFIDIDLTDHAFGHLAKEASRISVLLNAPKVQAEKRMVGCIDDLLGALYSLVFATRERFEDRVGPIEEDKVLIRAEQVAAGRLRTDGRWMAGFHLNSALFRESATYDRILATVVDEGSDLKSRRAKAQERYGWRSDNIHAIHGQVNALKHDRMGIHDGRRRDAGLTNAVAAFGELLALIEAWQQQP